MNIKTKSTKQKINDLVSHIVRATGILDPLLVSRRKMLVKKAQKEMARKTFIYNGIRLPYFYHHYHSTYGSERAIEISIGKHFLDTHDDILEIGNVMSHYFPTSHSIVDKYEEAPGIINEDVVDIKSHHENILAISTLEHVGFDEEGKDHTKFFKAMENIKRISNCALITLPWGYNPSVDEFVKKFKGKMTLYYREGREWKIGTLENIKNKTYASKYPCANAIAVVEIENPIRR